MTPKSIIFAPAYLLAIFVVSFPMVIELLRIKGLLFLFLILVVSIRCFKDRELPLHRKIVLISLFQIAVSLFFLAVGAVNGAPGVAKQAQVYVIWPLVYLFLLSQLTGRDCFKRIQNVLLLATVIIAGFGLHYILSELGIIPALFNTSFLTAEAQYGIQGGYLKMEVVGLNSLAFLIPYLIALLMLYDSQNNGKIYRCLLLITLFLGMALVVMSGRRAVLLVTMLAPIITIVLKSYRERSGPKVVLARAAKAAGWLGGALALPLIAISGSFDINVAGLYDFFVSGFDFSATAGHSETLRREQFNALLDGWLASPLIGSGLGSYTNASIRSADMPWSYELHYLSLLFQTGLVGFVSYCAGIGWLFWTGLKIVRSNDYFAALITPHLVGLCCFLIASASNPYLPTFEGIWSIFLPVAVINAWLLEQGGVTATGRA